MARIPTQAYPPLSRRSVLALGGAALGGCFASSILAEQTAADIEYLNRLRPDQHACVDAPIIPQNWTLDEQLTYSPVEFAIASAAPPNSTAATAAARAPAFAPAATIPQSSAYNTPAGKAAFASSWMHQKDFAQEKVLRLLFMNDGGGLIDTVVAIAREWQKWAGIRIEPTRNAASAHVRALFSKQRGHSSHIGPYAKQVTELSQPTMTLGFLNRFDFELQADYSRFVVLHEFGHALGMIHEHNRQDAALSFKETETYAYFRRLGMSDAEIKFNVFDRWNQPLIKASTYDEKSIMHYAYPAELMKDGKARGQNYDLSPLDKKFVALVYGPGTDDPGATDTTAEQPQVHELTVDGGLAKARISAGGVIEGKFTISSAAADAKYTIYTEGGTQVVLALYGPDGGKEITPTKRPEHGTPDLTNDVIQMQLKPGDYTIKVRHTSPRGGGWFSFGVVNGHKFGSRLLESNKVRE